MTLNPAEFMWLGSGLPRLGLFFHLACVPPVRLWLGVGAIQPGANTVDAAGATYRGAGELLDLPSFSHLFDGTADRVEFGLSGVPESVFAEIAPAIAEQQAAIQGRPVYAGWAAMDYAWQLVGPIHWEWFGFADLIRAAHNAGGAATDPGTAVLTLSCGDWMTGRRRAGLSFMTDPDQRRRAAELNPELAPDRFCERVGLYHQGAEKRWPPS
jgi:hypothetical protein